LSWEQCAANMQSEPSPKEALSATSPADRFRDYAPAWIITDEKEVSRVQEGDDEQKERLLNGELHFSHSSTHDWIAIGTRNIDWKGGHLNQREWAAQLNRFFQLEKLCRFYLQTGDECFAEVAAEQIADWIESHPAENFRLHPGDTTLTLAIRCGSTTWPGWLGTLPFFARSASFSNQLVFKILESAHAQLRFLETHLTPTNNWRLAQADAFVLAGFCFPELEDAAHFQKVGVDLLNEGLWRQFEQDGSHREHNPHYHVWMNSVYLRYWDLARRCPRLGLHIPQERVAAMLDYSLGTQGLDGFQSGLHDGHTLTSDGVVQNQKAGFPSAETLEKFCRDSGIGRERFETRTRYFPDAGQIYLRSEKHAEMLTFDATCWGGGHCHLSRNAVEFFLGERRLLRDGGIYSYDTHDPFMAFGKGTRNHNTVNLNGWNQGVADPSRTRVFQQDDRSIVASDYEGGYCAGAFTWSFREGTGEVISGRHHRTLFWHEGRFALVIDSVSRDLTTPGDAPSLECNWQLDAGIVRHEPDQRRAYTADPGKPNLLLQFLAFPVGAEILRFEGAESPLRGWLPGPGDIRPAPQISVTLREMGSLTEEFCTLLIPFTGTTPPQLKWEISKTDPTCITSLDLSWEDGTRDEIEWTQRLRYPLGHRPYGEFSEAFHHQSFPVGKVQPEKFTAFGFEPRNQGQRG